MSIPTVEKIEQFGAVIDNYLSIRMLALTSNQNVSSDTLTPVTELTAQMEVDSGQLYKYSGIFYYSAGSSGFVLSISNLSVLKGISAARFFNPGGTNSESIQAGGTPSWSCDESNISTDGVMLLDGYFVASDDRTLTIQARRQTASGTLILHEGSQMTFEKVITS